MKRTPAIKTMAVSDALSRRDFLKLSAAGAAALALPACLQAADEKRPNIVILISDDLGYADLGCQGATDLKTPHIDSLAKQGVRFTNGYVSCPVCSPSRAGLMTGRYQQRFGHEFNPGPAMSIDPGFGLDLSEITLADRLKAAGYATGLVGKWHLGGAPQFLPQKRGFEEFFGFLGGAHSFINNTKELKTPIYRGTTPVTVRAYLTDAFGSEAVSFIDRHKKTPFLLFVTFNDIHTPLQPPDKYLKRFTSIKDSQRQKTAAKISALDDAVGNIVDKLAKEKLLENTLIVFLSDNGGPTKGNGSRNTPLAGYKGDLLEGGIRVPFIMQWTGHIDPGIISDQPVISLDIHATALAAAGVDAKARQGKQLDGVNILDSIAPGKNQIKPNPHQYLYWRYGEQMAIRKGDLKLVRVKGEQQLYNLKQDIAETRDLSLEKPDIVKELRDAYDKWDSQLIAPKWTRVAGKKPGKRKRRAMSKARSNNK